MGSWTVRPRAGRSDRGGDGRTRYAPEEDFLGDTSLREQARQQPDPVREEIESRVMDAQVEKDHGEEQDSYETNDQ